MANRAAHPEWFNAPVPSFGELDARLLVVGLAPGVRGANRTGRPFTGDFAGVLLYRTLVRFGFAEGQYGADPSDGLRLIDCRVTNGVRCVPPGNLPVPAEIAACNTFLAAEFAAMPRLRAVLALGGVAHNAVLRSTRPEAPPRGVRPWRRARAARRPGADRQLSCVAIEHEHRAADRADVRRGGRGSEAATGMRRSPGRRVPLRGALAATTVPTWTGPAAPPADGAPLTFVRSPGLLRPGRRIYAIGDIHGCLAPLRALHAAIADDLARRPIADARLVHLGDYIDAGPDSAGVIALLAAGPPIAGLPTVNLLGDHERTALDALDGDAPSATDWLHEGGAATLRGWGIDPASPREGVAREGAGRTSRVSAGPCAQSSRR